MHWDGKLTPALTGGKTEDRLSVLVSGGVSKLLAVPVTDGKAEPTATTIMDVLNEWNLTDRIAALSFDTTAKPPQELPPSYQDPPYEEIRVKCAI